MNNIKTPGMPYNTRGCPQVKAERVEGENQVSEYQGSVVFNSSMFYLL
jgi:hypothetical protein